MTFQLIKNEPDQVAEGFPDFDLHIEASAEDMKSVALFDEHGNGIQLPDLSHRNSRGYASIMIPLSTLDAQQLVATLQQPQ